MASSDAMTRISGETDQSPASERVTVEPRSDNPGVVYQQNHPPNRNKVMKSKCSQKFCDAFAKSSVKETWQKRIFKCAHQELEMRLMHKCFQRICQNEDFRNQNMTEAQNLQVARRKNCQANYRSRRASKWHATLSIKHQAGRDEIESEICQINAQNEFQRSRSAEVFGNLSDAGLDTKRLQRTGVKQQLEKNLQMQGANENWTRQNQETRSRRKL